MSLKIYHFEKTNIPKVFVFVPWYGIDTLAVVWIGLLFDFDEVSWLLLRRRRLLGLGLEHLRRRQRRQQSQVVQHQLRGSLLGRLKSISSLERSQFSDSIVKVWQKNPSIKWNFSLFDLSVIWDSAGVSTSLISYSFVNIRTSSDCGIMHEWQTRQKAHV